VVRSAFASLGVRTGAGGYGASQRSKEEDLMLAALGGIGIVGIIVVILIILAILYFVRGRGTV
jgi:hypothetical protein